MNKKIKTGDVIEDTILVGTKGRDSKYSSKIYLIRFRKRVATELDEWFGPINELERKLEERKRK